MRDGSENGDLDQTESQFDHDKPIDGEYPVDRMRQRLSQSLGNRPIMVYLVLFAGAATLIVLLAIVWVSATGGGGDERPICTAITADEAKNAVLAGQVERLNVLVDRDQPLESLTGLVLDMTDGTCRQPDQGADVRNDLYMILGVVELYNNFGEKRVRVHFQRQDVQGELLVTSTPTPEPTIEPTQTPTPEPTATFTETATPEPTATATATETPVPPTETPTVPPTATTAPSPTATSTPTATATIAA